MTQGAQEMFKSFKSFYRSPPANSFKAHKAINRLDELNNLNERGPCLAIEQVPQNGTIEQAKHRLAIEH
jgi:hypothetical protein